MRTYLPFIEENENEGERWIHYIPVPGNEDAISKFKDLVQELGFNGEYTFGREMATEAEVDAVVKFGNNEDTYMPLHNKLEGTLNFKRLQKDLDEDDDPLYKGGIKDYLDGQERTEAVRDSEEGDGEDGAGGPEEGE